MSAPQHYVPSAALAKMVRAAGQAPSPDNNQPWAFRPDGSSLQVLHVRKRAVRSDHRDLFSWLALGPAIENLLLAACEEGWSGEVCLEERPFPKRESLERVATVQFRPSDGDPDPLAIHMGDRVTNRRPYRRTCPGDEVLERVVRDGGGPVRWVTGRSGITEAARLVRVADRIRFEHRPFHEELQEVIRYAPPEETTEGLPFATLEVPGALRPVLQFLRPWSRMKRLNRFGLSRVFAGISAKAIKASGALGLITTVVPGDPGYLAAGRVLQRVWLALTREGLSVQPLGSLPLFLARLTESETGFQPRHEDRLRDVEGPFRELFGLAAGEVPVMLLRTGIGKPPSARSRRLPLDEILIDG